MDNFDAEIRRLAESVLARCRARGWHVATAESCTGGLISGALTEIAGSSDVFDRGFATYSNTAKREVLGVTSETLERYGAVSEPTARAMAAGALAASGADLAVAVTGVAGPGGGSAEKPVGLVHFACAVKGGEIQHSRVVFAGDRGTVRRETVRHALSMLETATAR